MTSEVPAKVDLDEDEVALLAVEGARVQGGCVRDSLGVDEVGSRSMTRCEEGGLGLL